MTTYYLETIETRNGWTILRRYGEASRIERLPRYVVSTPDDRHLEEFRRRRDAQRWCDKNNDYAGKG